MNDKIFDIQAGFTILHYVKYKQLVPVLCGTRWEFI